jgi:8-oxo-dGTP diphosphatase
MNLPSFVYPIMRSFRFPPRLHWHLAQAVNARFLLGVAGIITDDAGRLLLFKHTYRRSHPWGMPGGWMQGGESPLQTLEREVLEESGLVVTADRLLLLGTTRDRPKLEFVVGGRLVSGTFRPSLEVSEMGWFAANEYPPLAVFHHLILNQLTTTNGHMGWYEAPWIVAHPR